MKKHLMILICLAAVLFFFKLGSFSLYDADETIYGEFIKQIHLTNDWITLHYNGQIIFDKPPLFYWLAAATTYVLGINEFAMRLWAALCGIATVLVTYLLGKEFYNRRVGFLAGIIVMTAFQFMVQSRIAEIDILLTLLISLSIYCFWLAHNNGNKYLYWLMYLFASLGVVTKGLPGIAIPGLAIFLFFVAATFLSREKSRDRSPGSWQSKDCRYIFLNELRKLEIIPGLLIFLLVGAPWYLIEWTRHGEIFLQFALGFLFLSRFQGVVSGHPGPWFYYFPAIMFGFAPWSHFIPYSLIKAWKEKNNPASLLCLCVCLPVFIVFSFAQTKLPNYMLPMYPFLAILVAKLWHDFLDNPLSRVATPLRGGVSTKHYKPMFIANILLFIFTLLMIIAIIILGTSNYSGQYQEMLIHIKILSSILILGSLASIIFFLRKRYLASFYSLPIMVFVVMFFLTIFTLPKVEEFKGSKELGAIITKQIKANEIIVAYETGNRPGIVFHCPKPVIFLNSPQEISALFKIKHGFLFTTPDAYEKIKKTAKKPYARKGDLLIIYYE